MKYAQIQIQMLYLLCKVLGVDRKSCDAVCSSDAMMRCAVARPPMYICFSFHIPRQVHFIYLSESHRLCLVARVRYLDDLRDAVS